MAEVGAAALPVLVGLILLFGYVKGVPVFDTFLSGAKEGLRTSLKLLPTLVGLLVAVSMVRASGLLELLCVPLAPLAESQRFGPDSPTGQMASVLSSSTETTFYAVAVYFGACGYQRLRHTLPAALLGDFTALVFSILTVKLLR